jgi:hypothetical protein
MPLSGGRQLWIAGDPSAPKREAADDRRLVAAASSNDGQRPGEGDEAFVLCLARRGTGRVPDNGFDQVPMINICGFECGFSRDSGGLENYKLVTFV